MRLGDDIADIEYRRRKNRERAEKAEQRRRARVRPLTKAGRVAFTWALLSLDHVFPRRTPKV